MRIIATAALLLAARLSVGADAAADPDSPAQSRWAGDYPYGAALAHEPMYDDKALWPHLTGAEYFLRNALPKARVLVWAKPGVDGGKRGLDPTDPANWIDQTTGKPADRLLDLETDLVLPAADTRYRVDLLHIGPDGGESDQVLDLRCITVARNAALLLPIAKVAGNVWVHRGGACAVDATVHVVGSAHTFHRNDNPRTRPGASTDLPTYLSQYLMFNKDTVETSAEFIGTWNTGDEFQVARGTLIVGADSVVEMGREAHPYVERNARIALMDNAYFGKWQIDFHCCDLEVRGGSLLAGLPDRPIRRSAQMRIGYKNHSAATYETQVSAEDPEERVAKLGRVAGMTFASGSTLRSYSADRAQARLVIANLPYSREITFLRPRPGASHRFEKYRNDPYRVAFWEWMDALPKGIDLAIAKGVTVEGVEFDGLRAGGLMLEHPADHADWKDVTWGRSNLAPVDALVAPCPPSLRIGQRPKY